MDGAFSEQQPLVNRLQEQEVSAVNAAKKKLGRLFQTEKGSVREVIRAFLESDEAADLTKKATHYAAIDWVDAALKNGHPDPRVKELQNVFLRFREEGGSLGIWAYEDPSAVPDLGKELAPEEPTREILKEYLKATLGEARPDVKAQAIFESLVERAKTAKELLSNIQLNPYLQSLSPEGAAAEYTAFLLSQEETSPVQVAVWKTLVQHAKKRISIKEAREEQVEWQNRMEDPEHTWIAKRNLIAFLVNAPGKGYLNSPEFEEDVAECLKKRVMRTHRDQLPSVLDQVEVELRANADKTTGSLEEQLKLQHKLDALDRIRTQALIAYGRPTSPEPVAQVG